MWAGDLLLPASIRWHEPDCSKFESLVYRGERAWASRRHPTLHYWRPQLTHTVCHLLMWADAACYVYRRGLIRSPHRRGQAALVERSAQAPSRSSDWVCCRETRKKGGQQHKMKTCRTAAWNQVRGSPQCKILIRLMTAWGQELTNYHPGLHRRITPALPPEADQVDDSSANGAVCQQEIHAPQHLSATMSCFIRSPHQPEKGGRWNREAYGIGCFQVDD